MRRHLWVCALAFATVSAAGYAAELPPKTTQSIRAELYPTYSALGIEVSYNGEDLGEAKTEFVWRKAGEDKWRNGVDMTYDRKRRLIWASIWPLDQGQEVEVMVTVRDGGGQTLDPVVYKASTRKMVITPAEGASALYVSPSGDDASEGTKDKPFKSIKKASSVAKPGDIVYALSGVYREGNLFAKVAGEEGKPIIFAAAEGAKPVIDGSADIAKGGEWKDEGAGVFSIAFAPPTGYAGYAAQDGKRMYLYRSMGDIKSDKYEAGRAWYYDPAAKTLYVRTGDESSPGDHAYNVALYEYGLDFLDSKHVVVRGFEIRYFGTTAVTFRGTSQDCVVVDNSIHNAPAGMALRDTARDNALWRNEVYENGLVDFSWNAVKASEYARQGVTGHAGRGTSICYNRIHGYFDGISPVSWKHPDELEINRDFDIMFNRIYNTGDDGIEVDGGGVNMRIHGNRLRSVFAAISLAPIERGPVYCTRNDMTYFVLNFKLNVGDCTSLGWAYCYHNSAYCLTNGRLYGGSAISFPPVDAIPIANKVFKNNVFLCDGLGVRYGYDDYTIDYNCYFAVPGGVGPRFSWSVKGDPDMFQRIEYDTIEDFTKATGRETHGIVADPRFRSTPGAGGSARVDYIPAPFTEYPQAADASAGDLSLDGASPCIDKGTVIRGFNEDFKGEGPDMGAFEFDTKPASGRE